MVKDLSLLILSCDAFSDLWDGHVKQLEKNWPDREINTYIVSEGKVTKTYNGVQHISAGTGMEWTDRLAVALNQIKTEFVLITLDDYFLIQPVDNEKIQHLVNIAKQNSLDYIRLFPRPKSATRSRISNNENIFWVDTKESYSVNLYSSIWKVDFLKSMIKKSKNAWQFEVGLNIDATKYGAKCAVSHENEFIILDVVRKGKILHKANRYFKKHPGIYGGNREVQTWKYEIGLGLKTIVGRHAPKFMLEPIRCVMRKFGYKFWSDDAGEQ